VWRPNGAGQVVRSRTDDRLDWRDPEQHPTAGQQVLKEVPMSSRKISIPRRSTMAACAITFALAASAVFAADPPPPAHPAPTKEMREKMATMHERMAACLRSDKAVAACHEEMMKSCKDTMGETGCPKMGMHDQMMKDHPAGTMAPK
jgi:hypothetical protein